MSSIPTSGHDPDAGIGAEIASNSVAAPSPTSTRLTTSSSMDETSPDRTALASLSPIRDDIVLDSTSLRSIANVADDCCPLTSPPAITLRLFFLVTNRHSAMPVSAEKDLCNVPGSATVMTIVSSQFSAIAFRTGSHEIPLMLLNGNTKAITPPSRTFLKARSKKCAAIPDFPEPRRSLPDADRSFFCISSCVRRDVSKAAKAALPAPFLSPSSPPCRVNGGFMITRSKLP